MLIIKGLGRFPEEFVKEAITEHLSRLSKMADASETVESMLSGYKEDLGLNAFVLATQTRAGTLRTELYDSGTEKCAATSILTAREEFPQSLVAVDVSESGDVVGYVYPDGDNFDAERFGIIV